MKSKNHFRIQLVDVKIVQNFCINDEETILSLLINVILKLACSNSEKVLKSEENNYSLSEEHVKSVIFS